MKRKSKPVPKTLIDTVPNVLCRTCFTPNATVLTFTSPTTKQGQKCTLFSEETECSGCGGKSVVEWIE